MENFILLMLFSYPGMISYMLYRFLAKENSFYSEPDTFSRGAWCFFLSTLVTVVTLCIMSVGLENASLQNLITAITATRDIWQYLAVSFLCSVVVGLVFYFAMLLFLKLKNRIGIFQGIAPDGLKDQVWREFVTQYNTTDCALIVRRSGRIVRAGMPEILPSSIKDDPSLLLSHCEEVEREYNKDDHGLLGNRFVSYYDLSTDTEFEFIASHALDEVIYGTVKAPSGKTTSPQAS